MLRPHSPSLAIDSNTGRIAFCLGDVSGKGINAALLMAKTASLYRCLAKTTPSPGQLLRQIDSIIAAVSRLELRDDLTLLAVRDRR